MREHFSCLECVLIANVSFERGDWDIKVFYSTECHHPFRFFALRDGGKKIKNEL